MDRQLIGSWCLWIFTIFRSQTSSCCKESRLSPALLQPSPGTELKLFFFFFPNQCTSLYINSQTEARSDHHNHLTQPPAYSGHRIFPRSWLKAYLFQKTAVTNLCYPTAFILPVVHPLLGNVITHSCDTAENQVSWLVWKLLWELSSFPRAECRWRDYLHSGSISLKSTTSPSPALPGSNQTLPARTASILCTLTTSREVKQSQIQNKHNSSWN